MVPLAMDPAADHETLLERLKPTRVELWLTRIRAHAALIGPVLLGLASLVILIKVAGRAAQLPGTIAPSTWWGMLQPDGSQAPGPAVGVIEIGAVAVLVWSWWQLLRSKRLGARGVAAIGALWSVPLTVGPVILSLDAYSYLAQGRLAQLGLDPYQLPPAALGRSAWLNGVDPFWRQSRSPYGPLTLLLQRLLVETGSVLAALVALHVFMLACLVVAFLVVARLTSVSDRPRVLLLAVVNPLVLLQLLGAAHWEALMVALLMGALWSWRSDRALLAIGLASTAAAVKAPAAFAVAVLVTLYFLAALPRRRAYAVVSAAGAAAAPWLALALVVPNPLGFVEAFSTPLTGRTLWAPTTLLAEVLAPAAAAIGVDVPFDAVLGACRAGGLMVAALFCAAMLLTARRRPAHSTIGLGLLAVALLGPVLYPWYIAWGLLPLAIGPTRHRRTLVALVSGFAFTALPGNRPLGMALLRLAADTPPAAALVAATVVLVAAAGIRYVYLLGPELTGRHRELETGVAPRPRPVEQRVLVVDQAHPHKVTPHKPHPHVHAHAHPHPHSPRTVAGPAKSAPLHSDGALADLERSPTA